MEEEASLKEPSSFVKIKCHRGFQEDLPAEGINRT